MRLLLDLHASLTYNSMAPILGLEKINQYDVSANCPFCSSHSWSISQDPKTLEEYYYCSYCKASGTVLAMAAQLLNLSVTDTIRYFSERLLLRFDVAKVTQAYTKATQRYATCEQFWQQAQQNMQRLTLEQRQTLFQLNWHTTDNMSPERFMRGPGRLYGVMPYKLVNNCVSTQFSTAYPYVAVLPFYRTPRQLSSFLCITPKKEVFYYADKHDMWNPAYGNNGFAGLQFLDNFQQNELIVTSLLQAMVQLHMHHFNVNETPLAMLGWHQTASKLQQRQWLQLTGHNPIIWENQLTIPVIQQAFMLNAKISLIGPVGTTLKASKKTWYNWLHKSSAMDLHRRIVKTAEPIDAALANWAKTATNSEKKQLLVDSSKLDETTFQRIRNNVDPQFKAEPSRVVRVPVYSRFTNSLTNQHMTIIEREGKWYNAKNNIRFPGIMRVTQIVIRPGMPKEYIGYVIIDKQRVDFRFNQPRFTWKWLWDFLLQSQVYATIKLCGTTYRDDTDIFNPLDVACQLKPPQIITGRDRIGWDGVGYQFKNYSIESGHITCNLPYAFPEDFPGPSTEFCPLSESAMRVLQEPCRELVMAWSFAIGLAAQITAEHAGLMPYPVAVLSSQGNVVSHMFTQFGLFQGPYAGWPHRWPRVLKTNRNFSENLFDNYFVVTTSGSRAWPSVNYVKKQHIWMNARKFTPHLSQIIPNYLLYFSRQPAESVDTQENLLLLTYKYMTKAFPFLPDTLIDDAYSRLASV